MNRKVLYMLSAVLVLSGLAFSVRTFIDGLEHCGCDLTMRINEVQCAHTGVNPFDVWERNVSTERFRGYDRGDKDPVSAEDAHKLVVHAYPPWHTTYCWFYGWLPRPITTALLGVVYGISLVFIVGAIRRRLLPLGTAERVFVWSWIIAMLLTDLVSCFGCLQYGLPLAALALFMYESLDKGRDGFAAVCWALMMIKPQVGLLFFFPLLFGKKYKVILLAGAICFIATLWPAWVYHESPIELILQVPKIGMPYNQEPVASKVLAPVIGKSATFVWAVVCASICAVGAWMFRKSGSWLVRTLPVAWMFPLWTYSQIHDHLATWSLVLVWGMLIVGVGRECLSPSARKVLGVCTGIEIAWLVFSSFWHFCVAVHFFNPAGHGWIYVSARTLQSWTVIPAVLFVVLLPMERARRAAHAVEKFARKS